jgi:hypothetical protein
MDDHIDTSKDARRNSLLNLLRQLRHNPIAIASKSLLWASALGAAALAGVNLDPSTLPPALQLLLVGLGVNSMAMLLDKISSGRVDAGTAAGEAAQSLISADRIQAVLNSDEKRRELAHFAGDELVTLIEVAAQKGDFQLALLLVEGWQQTGLIQEESHQHFERLVDLLSKLDAKRDEQYDDLVQRLTGIVTLLHDGPRLRSATDQINQISRQRITQVQQLKLHTAQGELRFAIEDYRAVEARYLVGVEPIDLRRYRSQLTDLLTRISELESQINDIEKG